MGEYDIGWAVDQLKAGRNVRRIVRRVHPGAERDGHANHVPAVADLLRTPIARR